VKYIMFAKEIDRDGLPHFVPVIFPEELNHIDMAACVMLQETMKGFLPIRAGFVTLELAVMGRTFPMTTHGRSETLKLESDPEDARIIKWYEYGGRHGGPYLIGE
jgi:hypothetical protein